MENLEDFLNSLARVSEEEILPEETSLTSTNALLYYLPWGFTIYRTHYGEDSDEHWTALVQMIRADVKSQILDKREEDPLAQQLLSLFTLDARSDASKYDGLSMDELRIAFRDKIGGEPMNADRREHRVALLVDQDVIDAQRAMVGVARNQPWVKCVEIDYVASEHEPRHWRLPRQTYFGWMKLDARNIPQFWDQLTVQWMFEFAPQGGGYFFSAGSIWDY
ncbi:unnamed protein product [Periconia digitata]|uniref:Uncharacterized protein n=1 Tax=Periconia digitata TaxID=1303443 RepID=A0A9W4U5G4_9PLEO|nr:unnamed protein product [Periconia digitata]